ncbi:MAG: hypothetical protein KJO95_08665 [Gammaproteobacteria bacterium]|nr:hypothetical protein [Gammaproteobacteria bacterium]MBU2676011.1 hypothetical protein [Gammaproteobacteria bacterium]NNC56104.1 hypothetical protein [Woeseiaceae bacterium]NNL49747.1 hypothetical protein [Woeseiaceae bacterium]
MDSFQQLSSIHKRLTLFLQVTLLIGVALAAWQGRWLAAIATSGIIVVTFLPLILGRRFTVQIPPEFEVLAVVFIYASLFLGEVRGYYVRFWWWDAILHAGSGFLLGILGFLLVYVLNERDDVDLHMQPRFVALFAFMFAVGMGAIWEIFEFAMDQLFGLNMQKSGLIDTMWDLIIDTGGAILISLIGWSYLSKAGSSSFLERWIAAFINSNPRLFKLRKHD